MKALILAAGFGTRMRPLTDRLPKPLLTVGGMPLIDHHLYQLAAAGITEVAINLAHLGEKIKQYCGDGSRYGVQLHYSDEGEPLETGGAINKLLPWLGDSPFLLVNGDVFCPSAITHLSEHSLASANLGHLLMVPNPDFHPAGDFAIAANGQLRLDSPSTQLTYSGLALLHPDLIRLYDKRRDSFTLGEALRFWIEQDRLSGSLHTERWSDVGTPARLIALAQDLAKAAQDADILCAPDKSKQATESPTAPI